MSRFVPNQPVAQRDRLITVDSNRGLAIGAHRFRLIVVDDSGNESEPNFLHVIVQDRDKDRDRDRDRDKPTVVLDVVDASGARIDAPVPAGRTFRLWAARSTDSGGGRVVEYRFPLVPRA
ncbi:MAG: hypothetical protein ACK5SX_12970 [Sandaracinobacter sp.]